MQMNVWNKRIAAVVVVAGVVALYALAELVYALRGTAWHRLESGLDRMDDRLDAVEFACTEAGDVEFVDGMVAASQRASNGISALAARLVREPAR
jgi:hypothetical protein